MDADWPEITLEDLKSWENHGAMWHALAISNELAVLELCTCFGEPVDTVQSAAPELIDFVRSHREQE